MRINEDINTEASKVKFGKLFIELDRYDGLTTGATINFQDSLKVYPHDDTYKVIGDIELILGKHRADRMNGVVSFNIVMKDGVPKQITTQDTARKTYRY
jgi:hypothetical protein